ncbi:janus kinase and microtubule-interacting protein 3-like [Lethenteron reissneri]|uniref:janus kinase and microtubule-interacting protein 3-like n=1 Tax=Lethenteron reissneri TaxID=7753 RepID=UPI002AB7A963|nr:janus kinase and microtubule-interacting protein 3-like [Lethenteron reissneri]
MLPRRGLSRVGGGGGAAGGIKGEGGGQGGRSKGEPPTPLLGGGRGSKGGECGTPEALIDSLQAANEDLRAKLTDIQIELQQEKGKVSRLEREKVQEVRYARDQEQKRHAALHTELKAKLHEEKLKDVQAVRESLIRTHEMELVRVIKMKDGEIHRLQGALVTLRDGAQDKVKAALQAEAREDARRAWEGERARLLHDLETLKAAKKQVEEMLTHTVTADKQKAADLRTSHHAHQEEVTRIKRDSERDIRRLMDELKSRERSVLSLERELGAQAGYAQRLALQREALDEASERRNAGSPKREIPAAVANSGGVTGGAGGDCMDRTPDLEGHLEERDVRRFQLRIGELHGVVRKLEDRNALLADERNELLKRVRETEAQLKPLLDKNRRLAKKCDDLVAAQQRQEERVRGLSRENLELKEKVSVQSAAAQLAHAAMATQQQTAQQRSGASNQGSETTGSHTVTQPTQAVPYLHGATVPRPTTASQTACVACGPPSGHEEMEEGDEADENEIEFLRLQVAEQQNIIDDLTKALQSAAYDRNAMELDIIRWQRKQKRRSSRSSKRILTQKLVGVEREMSLDSDSSSYATDRTAGTPGTPDTDMDEQRAPEQPSMAREETELRFRHLMHEYQALQRAYSLLHEQLGGGLDAERDTLTREQLQADLLKYQARVEDLERALSQRGQVTQADGSTDATWVEEKQQLCRRNQELLQKLHELENDENSLKQEVQDLQDQNELMEFRILELEERERRSPGLSLLLPPFREGDSPLQWYCAREAAMEVSIHELMKKLDLLGDNANLRNDEQVAVIQARTVLSLADKWLHQIEGTEIALQQKMIDLENEKEMFVKQKRYLEEELDYRKQALDQAYMRVRELEATLYSALQQKPPAGSSATTPSGVRGGAAVSIAAAAATCGVGAGPALGAASAFGPAGGRLCSSGAAGLLVGGGGGGGGECLGGLGGAAVGTGGGLSDKEREHLQGAVEQWKRQVLGQIREYDARVLRERMESLQHAHKKIRDLEKKLERQREQIKDLEEKFLFLFLFFSLAFIIWS